MLMIIIFLPYLDNQFGNAKRLAIVWDTYISDSLKESTREKRDEGIKRKVSGNTKLSRKWFGFLRDSKNKELFEFFTTKVVKYNWPLGKNVYITSGSAVALSGSGTPVEDCNHEEADTRLMVHILHSLQQGVKIKSILVCTVDTDVVVILVGIFYDLIKTQPFAGIWLAFGMDKHYRFYHVSAYVQAWKSKDHEHFLCSTRFLVVTQPLHSKIRLRRPFGKHGEHIKTPLIYMFIRPHIHFNC